MQEIWMSQITTSEMPRHTMSEKKKYLDAVKLAPERVRAFLNAVLTRGKEVQDISQERGRKRKESTIDR